MSKLFIVPQLHPAALLRGRSGDGSGNDDNSMARFEETTIADMRKALRLTRSSPQWDERAIWERDSVGRLKNLFPTADEVIEFCRSVRGQLCAVDVETNGETPMNSRLLCVGLASITGRVLCIPFLSQHGVHYWSHYDQQRVRAALAELLADPATVKVAHNYIFDSIVLWSHGMPMVNCECTMQMHHVIDSELPMGLGFCGTRYLDIRYWKDDVKGDEGWLSLPDEILRSYNLRDCLVTLQLVPIFMDRLRQLGLVGLYREELQVAGIMGRASVRGLPIDFDRRDLYEFDEWVQNKKSKQWELKRVRGLGPQLVEQMNSSLAMMRALAGDPTFDPLKPTALRQFMFGRLQLPIVKMSKSGVHPSTDREAMVLLALAADKPEQRAGIKALADFKSAHKAKSTFVDGLGRAALADGRLHVFWKLLSATGRLMSTPNAQNFSKRIKRIFGYTQRLGPSGRKLVGVDLKQAEMRGIAYLAKHQRLLEMYERDLNVHTFNAMLALHVRPAPGHKDLDAATEAYVNLEASKMTLDPKNFIEMPDGPWGATRTLMKKDGFGRNYGADDDTVFRIERSDRDPETNELLFPTLQRSDVQANGIVWARMNPWTRQWWEDVQREVKLQGFHKCPVSGRIRWFRAGFKRTEILGHPNQTLIASIVNKRTIEIQATFDRETGGEALIVQQVHDAVNSEVPDGYEDRSGQVMVDAFEQRVALPGYPNAYFPADKPTVGYHLDEI